MRTRSKLLTLAGGALACISAAAMAQDPAAPPLAPAGSAAQAGATIVVSGGLDWLEQSEVAAKQAGVLEAIEFNVGSRVQAGQEIGRLDDAIANLTVTRQRLVAESTGAILKAEAQREQATATLARVYRLNQQGAGFVSKEELSKAEADVNYADALRKEAQEKQAIDTAELSLAEKTLEHHKIVAPFSGVIIERHKNPGEAIQPNEPVVRLGKTDKLRFVGWVPLESAVRVREGDAVQFRPVVDGYDLAIERKLFNGKVMSISRELSTTGDTATYILAEIDNPPNPEQPELELLQGMKGEITIQLNGPGARVAGRPAASPAPGGQR